MSLEIKKLSQRILFIALFGLALKSQSAVINVSCDNEAEEAAIGTIFFEVDGKINLNNSLSQGLALKMKQVGAHQNQTLAIIPALNLTRETKGSDLLIYRFIGMIGIKTFITEIKVTLDPVKGATYKVLVNQQNLPWCTPL